MTVTFHALWMLCALGTVVFAAAAAPLPRRAATRPAKADAAAADPHVRDRAALAIGFAVMALLMSGSDLPDAVWTGGMATVAAAAYLFKPRLRLVSLGVGGGLAGAWTALLEVQGLPPSVALLVAAALLIGTMHLSQTRPSFAPEELREEGLLAIGVLGLGVAVIPGVLDGWHAAANLSGEPARSAVAAAVPMWTLAVILTASSLGALYSLWSRR